MWCWNATCGISNLPIMHGEKVVAFICKPNNFDTRPSYSTTLCAPICFQIKGIYNDYGSIEQIKKSKYTDNLLDFFNKKYNMDFKNVEECIEFVADGENELFFFMVKEELFNILIDEIGNRKPYKNKLTYRQLQLYKLKNWQKLKIKLNKIDKKSNYNKYCKIHSKIMQIEHSYFLKLSTLPFINKNYYIDHILEFILFMKVIDESRKSFVPQNGFGSQSGEMYLQKLIGEYIVKEEKSYVYQHYVESDSINSIEEKSEWYESDSAWPSKETLYWWGIIK